MKYKAILSIPGRLYKETIYESIRQNGSIGNWIDYMKQWYKENPKSSYSKHWIQHTKIECLGSSAWYDA